MADDLFTRDDELDAEAAVASAEEARRLARYKAVVAPAGQVRRRHERLAAATHAALLAEVELMRVRKERAKH